MCINFTPTTNTRWVEETFDANLSLFAFPKEVYPGYLAPIVLQSHKTLETKLGLAEFGLIPSWSKDKKIQKHTYNARMETVSEKPSYRTSWANRRFAICLVDNFFEPNYESGNAVRFCIEREDRQPFGIASLWDTWVNKDTGELTVSFTMLTCNADEHPVMKRFHKPNDEKRTPVILDENQFEDWLSATPAKAMEMLNWGQFPNLNTYEQLRTGF